VADPAGTDTLARTKTFALLLERLTKKPPAGAAALRETAQKTLPGPVTVAGLQVREDSCATPGDKAIDADCEVPPAEAVITAVPEAVTEETVPVKLPVADPVATSTLTGTTMFGLLLLRPTKKPPAGAAALKETVQETLPDPATVAGLQVKEDTCAEDTVRGHVPVAATPLASVTLRVKEPAAVGVPVTAPVEVFKVRPAGSVPVATEKV